MFVVCDFFKDNCLLCLLCVIFLKIIVNDAVFTNGVSVGQKCHFDVLSCLGSSISSFDISFSKTSEIQ